jgi:hypothetical protein
MIERPPLFAIPAGWREDKPCTCGSRLWKVPHPTTGNKQPLAIQTAHAEPGWYVYAGERVYVTDAAAPSPTFDGYGWNHFRDCPDRERFRRKTLGTTSEGRQVPSLSKKGLVIVAQALESIAVGLVHDNPSVAQDLGHWAHALRYGHHPSEGRCDPATCESQETVDDERAERRVVSNAEITTRIRTMWEACSPDGAPMMQQAHGAITLAFRLGVFTETEVMTWRKALDTCPFRDGKQDTHPASQVWCAYCGELAPADRIQAERHYDNELKLPEGFTL